MGTEIEALRAYYKDLAEENPDMELVANQLGIAGDLNKKLGGPDEMPGMITVLLEKAREKTTFVWKQKLVNFCAAFPVMASQKPFDWQAIAIKFNECFHIVLTDDTNISDLRIPSQEDSWTADKSLREVAKRIDPKFKGAYNMRLNYILRGMGLDTTVGQIREASNANLLEKRRISAESVQFFRAAFARPAPQEASAQ